MCSAGDNDHIPVISPLKMRSQQRSAITTTWLFPYAHTWPKNQVGLPPFCLLTKGLDINYFTAICLSPLCVPRSTTSTYEIWAVLILLWF
jgi:hypothetical protein